MKIFKISTFLFALFVFPLFSTASANPPTRQPANPSCQMIFWYPGEAGSTSDAQNTLDMFFDYVNERIMPYKISGKYFNTVPEGMDFIKRSRPKIGIISFAAATINKDKIGANTTILQTLPLPDGKVVEQYTIVGKGPKPSNWNNVELFSKQPLNSDLIQRYILNANTPKLTLISNLLLTLKDLAAGTKQGGAILQPMEYFTLRNLNQPWAKELVAWQTSKPIPTAQFVVFGEADDNIQKIKNVVLKMNQEAKGKEILETLRLKGFADAN